MKLVTSAPITEGIQLYHGLINSFNVVLVTDDDKEKTDYWLKLENLNRHGVVLYGDDFPEEENRRIRQVSSLRLRGFAVDLVVEPDPAIAAAILRSGFTVCNFVHRAYAFPSWRPDFEEEQRGWEEIERQVIKDKLLRATDNRTEE